MKLFKKIKHYPNSKNIPEIIKEYDEFYYSQLPNKFPEFWEELIDCNVTIVFYKA